MKVLLIVVAVALVAVSEGKRCHNTSGRQLLDMAKFTGTWYKIMGGPGQTSQAQCIEETFTQSETNKHLIDYTHKSRMSGSWHIENGIVTIKDLSNPGEMDFYAFDHLYESSLVASDPNSWAIWNFCADEGEDVNAFTVFSRTRELSPEVTITLKNVIESFGLKADQLTNVSHVGC